MKAYHYVIHGLNFRLVTDSVSIASAVQTFLHGFQQERFDGPLTSEILFREVHDRAEIPITISSAAQVLASRKGETVGDALRKEWGCTLYRDQDRQVVDFHEQGLVLIDDRQGCAEGYLVEPEAMHPDIRVTFFHFSLIELLKRQGVYTLHAAGLEKKGRGILIPGTKGRGKTTSCLSLLRAGYRCLSDDHTMVRANATGLELLAFPEKVNVTDQTIAFFPELQEIQEELAQGLFKRSFDAETLYPHASIASCTPAFILFPQVIDWPKSSLEPLPKSRALEELLPHGLSILDKDIARQEFQTLARLVEQSACYRLYFGEDVLELPHLIDQLMQKPS